MFARPVPTRARHASPLHIAIVLVVLSACGFGKPAAAASNATPQANAQKAQAAFTAMSTCLTKAGYHMAGPPTDEVPANAHIVTNNSADEQLRGDPGYKAAYDRCATSTGFKQFASSQPNRKPSARQIRKTNQQVLKLYACLRQKGWTLPDPTKGSDGQLSPPLPPSDIQGDRARMDQFANDLKSCANAAGLKGSVQAGGGGGGSVSFGG